MSFPIITSGQYDATKYTALGSVLINRVEALSLLRADFASFGALFGGKNQLIQGAIDQMQTAGLAEFTAKVQSVYPNTVQVVGMQYDISDVGRNDNSTMYMVLTISGTCLAPIGQTGGGKRKTLKRKY